MKPKEQHVIIEQKSHHKKSFMHFTVQDYKGAPHFLIPTQADQQQSSKFGGLRVEAVHTSDKGKGRNPHVPHVPNARIVTSGWDRQYDYEMINVEYGEKVAVAGTDENIVHKSCVTNCDFDWRQNSRCREEVEVAPLLSPTEYRSSIICYTDCTKKRFKSTVHYEPKMTPRNVTETCFVRQKSLSTSYTSFVDVRPPARRWFTSTVLVKPQTYSSNTVHNFQCLDEKQTDGYFSDGSSVDEGIERGDYSGPTSPVSSIQDESRSPGINIQTLSEAEGNRSTIVVNGYVPGGSWNGYLSDGSDDIAEV